MGRIDDNNNYVAMAVTDDSNLTPTPLKVDPVTTRLLIDIVATPGAATAPTRLPTDANSHGVSEAVTDDANADIRPWLADSNSYLLCDVLVE